MSHTPIAKGTYRHFKGMMYRVLDEVRHSETLETYVLYETLYENKLGKLWIRPLSMFTEIVEHNGQRVPRFTRVE